MSYSTNEIRALPQIISTPRFETYLRASQNDIIVALKLYQWNLEISAAFIVPLQICEVAARNGVVTALEQKYGQNWHLVESFKASLPKGGGYNAFKDFQRTSSKLSTTGILTSGRVVANVKFAFWETMLTQRHDIRLWNSYLNIAFPYIDKTNPVHKTRGIINTNLKNIRKLRNRIAHHEPIFTRNISAEYERILKIIDWCCPVSAQWIDTVQTVTALNDEKPIP